MSYADDIVAIGRSMGTLNDVHMQMQTAASSIGLEINIKRNI
jgi:hypothetical protein